MRKFLLILVVALLLLAAVFPVHAQSDIIDKLLQQMTLEQKVGQIFMVSFSGPLNEPARNFLAQMQAGAFALFSSNGTSPEDVTRFVNSLQQIATQTGANLPMIMAIDHEGGTVRRLREGFTDLPWGPALSAMPAGDAYTVGQIAAQELLAVGITMNLAPVADVRSDPTKHFMEKRSFGNDPISVGGGVAAYTQGLQAGHVIGVLKHFPGHGAADDSHSILPTINATREELNRVELVPFKMGIDAGADVVMLGHLVVPALETVPDWPASLSSIIINDVLRKQLGFNGLVITDALDMGAIVNNVSQPDAAVIGVQAGVDMIVAGPHTPISNQIEMRAAVLEAVKTGKISMQRLDEAVRRVLTLKQKYNLFGWEPLNPQLAPQRVNTGEHSTTVSALYRDTVAIAKDNFKLLPLTNGKTVLIIFPGAYPAAQRECLALNPKVRSLSYSLNPTDTEIATAKIEARRADLVVVFTYNMSDYPFQASLVSEIPPEKTVMVALESPYDIEWNLNPAAYVTAFNAYPGAIKASCEVLFGAYPAKGKWNLSPLN